MTWIKAHWTRDDRKWWWGQIVALVLGLGPHVADLRAYGVPDHVANGIGVAALVLGIACAKMHSSPLKGRDDA